MLQSALQSGPAAAAAVAAAVCSALGPGTLPRLLTEALRQAGPQRAAFLLPLWPAGEDSPGPELAVLRRLPPSVAALCAVAVSEQTCRRLVEEEGDGDTASHCNKPTLESLFLSGSGGEDTITRLMVSDGV